MRPARFVQLSAWAFYDFAVTVFAMTVISRYFGLWLTEERQGSDWWYSVAFAASTGLAALLMPALGVVSDRTGRLPWLRAATLLIVIGTALIPWCPGVGWGSLAFGAANLGCQVGGICYDALLPSVASGRQVGLISGLGVALGYVGSATGLLLAQPFAAAYGYGAVFAPTAALILVTALPAMLLIREAPAHMRPSPPAASTVWSTVRSLFAGADRVPGLARFLIGCFFGINAINTVIIFMAIYARRAMGMTDAEIDSFLLFSTAFALAGALGSGWCADRFGPRRCLLGIFALWIVAIALAALARNARWLWIVGPLVGVSLGGTWATSRAWLVALSPVRHVGAVFGLFGLVGRASSNIGPLLWGRITAARDVLGPWTDRLALASLLGLLIIAWWCLLGIPEPARPAAAAA